MKDTGCWVTHADRESEGSVDNCRTEGERQHHSPVMLHQHTTFFFFLEKVPFFSPAMIKK